MPDNRWVTNAAVEAAVRRVTPKLPKPATVSNTSKHKSKAASVAAATADSTGKSLTTDPSASAQRLSECEATTESVGEQDGSAGRGSSPISSGACVGQKRQRVASARLAEAVAAAAASASNSTVASRRLRGKTPTPRACDPPGAKRARAAASVAAYVEREYAKFGKPWLIERPTGVESIKESGDRLPKGDEARKEEIAEDAAMQDAMAPAAGDAPEVALGDGDTVVSGMESGDGQDDALPLATTCVPSLVEMLGDGRVKEMPTPGVQQPLQNETTVCGSEREASVGCGVSVEGLDATTSFAMMFEAPHHQVQEQDYRDKEQRRCERRPHENGVCVAPCGSWLPSSHGNPTAQCPSHGNPKPSEDRSPTTSRLPLSGPNASVQGQFPNDQRGAAVFEAGQPDQEKASVHAPAVGLPRASMEGISEEAEAVIPDAHVVCVHNRVRGTPPLGPLSPMRSADVEGAAVHAQGKTLTAGANGVVATRAPPLEGIRDS